MRKHDVKCSHEALAYITDCNLATICGMAGKKSRPKSEYSRQKAIAQQSIDWMRSFGVDFSTTRAMDVVREFGGSVDAWAAQWEGKC
jgi:hypothetical protein